MKKDILFSLTHSGMLLLCLAVCVSWPGLAKWSGSDWVNIGFAGVVLAMVSDGTNLYVGGSFTNAGGVLNTNVARYDGTNWYSLGTGLGYYNNFSSFVSALE